MTTLPCSTPFERTTITIDYDENDVFGIDCDDELTVLGVAKGTPADGKILFGDRIVAINGKLVKDKDCLYRFLQRMYPQVVIQVDRPQFKTSVPPQRFTLSGFIPDTKANDYFIAHITRFHNQKLGLAVKTSAGDRVIVAGLDENSTARYCLAEGDRIVDINGERICTKDVAKTNLKKALHVDGYASLLVEREKLMKPVYRDPKLPKDCIRIANNEISQIKLRQIQRPPKPKPILIRTGFTERLMRNIGLYRSSSEVKFNFRQSESFILSDVKDASRLTSVPNDRNNPNYELTISKMPRNDKPQVPRNLWSTLPDAVAKGTIHSGREL